MTFPPGEYNQNQCQQGDATCTSCPSRLPSCVGLPDGLVAVPGQEYTSNYLECNLNRTLQVKHCDTGFFDSALHICVNKINSGKSYCSTMFDTLANATLNQHHFLCYILFTNYIDTSARYHSQSLLLQSASCSRHHKTWSRGDQSRFHVQIIGWQRVIVLQYILRNKFQGINDLFLK